MEAGVAAGLAVELIDITKTFPGVVANGDAARSW
jgi:hypothetical protein